MSGIGELELENHAGMEFSSLVVDCQSESVDCNNMFRLAGFSLVIT